MKRIFCAMLILCFVVVLALPAAAAELQGGYYIVCDCALGTGIRFYVPASAAEGCFTYDASGYLFNLSASTVYLYSPDFPDYTFSAARFSGFQYRTSSGMSYDTVDLDICNITDTNIEIFKENPTIQGDLNFLDMMHVLVEIGSFAIAFLLLLKVGDKRV